MEYNQDTTPIYICQTNELKHKKVVGSIQKLFTSTQIIVKTNGIEKIILVKFI